jgi:hypothetical protein
LSPRVFSSSSLFLFPNSAIITISSRRLCLPASEGSPQHSKV